MVGRVCQLAHKPPPSGSWNNWPKGLRDEQHELPAFPEAVLSVQHVLQPDDTGAEGMFKVLAHGANNAEPLNAANYSTSGATPDCLAAS